MTKDFDNRGLLRESPPIRVRCQVTGKFVEIEYNNDAWSVKNDLSEGKSDNSSSTG